MNDAIKQAAQQEGFPSYIPFKEPYNFVALDHVRMRAMAFAIDHVRHNGGDLIEAAKKIEAYLRGDEQESQP